MTEHSKTFSTEQDVDVCRQDAVPKNTLKHTLWGVNVYKAWARSRNEYLNEVKPEHPKYSVAPEDLSCLSVDEINFWLCKFCVDVKQKNGEEYKPEVLYSLFCAINRVVRESKPGLALFQSPQLKPLQDVLDSRLKDLQSRQDPIRKKVSMISEDDEEKLWLSGALGTHCPTVLFDTLVFMVSKIFALQGGQNHRSLSRDSFEFDITDDGKTVVSYRENTAKVKQGGLKRRKVGRKEVNHIEDGNHPRSFTHIFNFYTSKCPLDCDSSILYLQPRTKWCLGTEFWYEKRPVGHNMLSSAYRRICNLAGLEGQHSNHSEERQQPQDS